MNPLGHKGDGTGRREQMPRLALAADDARLHDLSVSLRRSGDAPTDVSRMEVFYYRGRQRMSICCERAEPRFAGSSRRMLQEAVGQLLAELRFQLREHPGSRIWYASVVDRAIIETIAGVLAAEDSKMLPQVDRLLQAGELQ